MTTTIVFRTASEMEARVVLALLDSQGIQGMRAGGLSQGVWPMAITAEGEFGIAARHHPAGEFALDALHLGRHLLGNAEAPEQFEHVHPAGPEGERHRGRGKERLLQRFGGAEIRVQIGRAHV